MSPLTTLRQQAGVVETYNEKIMNPVHRVCLECESEYPSLPSLSLSLSLWLSHRGWCLSFSLSSLQFLPSCTVPDVLLIQSRDHHFHLVFSSFISFTDFTLFSFRRCHSEKTHELPASEPTTSAMQITVSRTTSLNGAIPVPFPPLFFCAG